MNFKTLPFFLLVLIVSHGQVKVQSLKIQGNNRTKSSLIRRLSKLKEGATLDSLVIEADIARLIRLPSVSHAYYQVNETDSEDGFTVVYGIEENFTLIPVANIFTSNDDEFAFRVV